MGMAMMVVLIFCPKVPCSLLLNSTMKTVVITPKYQYHHWFARLQIQHCHYKFQGFKFKINQNQNHHFHLHCFGNSSICKTQFQYLPLLRAQSLENKLIRLTIYKKISCINNFLVKLCVAKFHVSSNYN